MSSSIFQKILRFFRGPEEPIFYLGPFLVLSFIFHGLAAFLLMKWVIFSHPESPPKILRVQIVEERKEREIYPPIKFEPGPKKVHLPERAEEETPPSPPRKEGEENTIPPTEERKQEITMFSQIRLENSEKKGAETNPRIKSDNGKEKEEVLSLPGNSAPPRRGEDSSLAQALKSSAGKNLAPADRGLAVSFGGLGHGISSGKGVGTGEKNGEDRGREEMGASTGAAFGGGGKGQADTSAYFHSLRLKVEKAKQYPKEAIKKGWEGKVTLSFQINPDGMVAEIEIIQSSGHRILDQEGIATIRRASPFPPVPMKEMKSLKLHIPIVFKLEKGS